MSKLEICLGSSCYCRGNSDYIEIIEKFLQETSLQDSVDFVGTSCEGYCAQGPTLKIDSKRYFEIDREVLIDLINKLKK